MKKYPGEVFVAYYIEDKKNAGMIRWLEDKDAGLVHIDRTRTFDFVVRELTADKFSYFMKSDDLEDYAKHWSNIHRIVEEDKWGKQKARWIRDEGRPDHYAHAHVYYRVALEKVFSSGGDVVEVDGQNE